MKNILIVEGDSDKFFFDALIRKMNITAELRAQPFCNIDDYECLEGDSLNKLIQALDSLKMQARKSDIERIGIIIDQDTKTVAQRLELINKAMKEVFPESPVFKKVDTFADVLIDEHISIPIACHLLNVEGKGNLETVLKTIHNQDATQSDCLESWRNCIEENNKSIKDSDFDKFWVQIYMRYDQCTKKEQKQAGRKCNTEVSMQKDIWNFDHVCLNDLKQFLDNFK